ncbi:heterokaryon incompatibility protein [Colletotrichum incanum]|uniref:Heterokaryon incompatibility protein n=1 Tax=Colletotrichum incanum TaxID=1573173 RepID=A0A166ZWZ3_COLIC|nr:heterokaryon incompatibility protein [Colletotrichum incanum]
MAALSDQRSILKTKDFPAHQYASVTTTNPSHLSNRLPVANHNMNPNICITCQKAFSKVAVKTDDFRRRRRNRHHASPEDLIKAVEGGCDFCRRFARYSTSPGISTALNEDIILHPRPEPVRLFFAESGQHLGRGWREGDLDDLVCFSLVRQDSISANRLPARLDKRMGSPDTLEVMSKWLNGCNSSHPECKWRVADSYYPSRLIDVGPPGSLSWTLRINEQGPPPLIARGYLTLSHRWGSSPFIQLTSDTLLNFQGQVPVNHLPQTFRDMVSLAHHFGIRYIWIDSLCILQDSNEDWQKEALDMRGVYHNSACNIIAAYSEGPDGGLFRDRDPSVLESFVVRSERTDITPGLYLAWDHTSILNDYSRAPLNERGWAFQERLLPGRSLHFGKDQVFWRCSQLFACESLPHGIPLKPEEEHSELEKTLASLRKEPVSGLEFVKDHEKIMDMWEKLVEEYSGCVLTYEKDKLVALAGVAMATMIRLGPEVSFRERYLAGLWESRLVWQLCWRLKDRTGQRPRPEYRAPSWSWASVEGKVCFEVLINRDEDIISLVSVVEANVVPLAGSLAGQVIDGSVILTGCVHAFEVIDNSGGRTILKVDGQMLRLDYDPFVFDSRREFKPPSAELVLLPMVCSRERPVNSEGVEIAGLVLQPSIAGGHGGSNESVYQRMGYFNFRPDDGKGENLLFGTKGFIAEELPVSQGKYDSERTIKLI